VLLACGDGGEPAEPSEPGAAPLRSPNVILIVIDTLRADHLGAYGYARKTSPHIDALAAESLVYERAISPAPWTTPAVGALLTSLYPTTLGIDNRQSSLAEEHLLLSEVLQRRGWATGAVVSHHFCSSRWNFDQGFDAFDESNVQGHRAVTSPAVTDRGLEFITARQGEPFFLWLHYFDPHVAYVEHEGQGFADGGAYQGPIVSGQDFKTLRAMQSSITPADLGELQRLYDSEIAFTDRAVGRLLEGLKAGGLYDDAIVILTADHGEEFLERGSLGHAKTVYQELIHVPLMIKLPGVEPRRITEPVGLVDIYPTLLEFLEEPVPDGLAGRSLLPEALGAAGGRHPVFSETRRGGDLRAVIDGDAKLVVDRRSRRSEFYRLDSDPAERHDLAAREPEEVARLRSLMDAWIRRSEARVRPGADVTLSPEERERLEALGYAE